MAEEIFPVLGRKRPRHCRGRSEEVLPPMGAGHNLKEMLFTHR